MSKLEIFTFIVVNYLALISIFVSLVPGLVRKITKEEIKKRHIYMLKPMLSEGSVVAINFSLTDSSHVTGIVKEVLGDKVILLVESGKTKVVPINQIVHVHEDGFDKEKFKNLVRANMENTLHDI